MILKDPVIREKLKSYLLNLPCKPRAIIDELHVHKGNAIADVVAVYKEPHCFEIKGETDNTTRLRVQGQFYNQVFKRITLITTEKHLKKAQDNTPEFWGIIIAFVKDGTIKFRHHRKSRPNPKFNKEVALYTLWRQEMLELSNKNKIEIKSNINKHDLAHKIAAELTVTQVNKEIANSLLHRHQYTNPLSIKTI